MARGRSRGVVRRRPQRRERKRILVVTEGLRTEPQYLDRLQQCMRDANAVVKHRGVGKDPRDVVKKCIELRDAASQAGKAYDSCYCLVDVDEHGTLDMAIQMAQREGIHLLISNLKFEVWLIWHLKDLGGVRTSHELDDLVKNHGLMVDKSISGAFPIQGVEDAVRRAYDADPYLAEGRVGPSPSSALPILIDAIKHGR